MPYSRHLVPVRAPLETVWELLLDKVEHPHRYIESVLDFAILGQGEDWTLREMTLPGCATLREFIRVDATAHTLVHTLVDHPCFEGEVINRVTRVPGREDLVELEFAMDWLLRPGAQAPEDDPADLVRSAVEHTREIAEELARAAGV